MEITALPIYDVRLIRDKLTNTSRGFCFVELGSVGVTLCFCLFVQRFIKAMYNNYYSVVMYML